MKRICASLAVAATLSVTAAARAATFTVSTLADAGSGSLRAAVALANAAPGDDSIRFQPGLQGTIQLASEILITDSVTIDGPGQALLIVAGSASSRIFRLARAGGPRTTTVLSGMTLDNGHANDGGAINADDENLVVRNAVFSGNAAVARGGAVRLAKGDLTLEDVTLIGNRAGSSGGGSGGAIDFGNGTLRLLRCVVRDNSATYGGGLRLNGPAPNVVIEDSLFMDNFAGYHGGAIDAGPAVPSFRVSRSGFVGNSSNQAIGAAINFHGSISTDSSPGVIENSTFSGNHTAHPNGHGVIAVHAGTLYLRNSTLAYNRTANGSTGAPNEGGALWIGAATVHVDSTLFAHNTHGSAGQRVDFAPSSNPDRVFNVSHSLLHTTPVAGLINGANVGNQFDTDALLQPLTIDAGPGFVPLHPIPLDSPAIDAGSNPANLATDQRGPGYPRSVDLIACRSPQLARSDVGSYEYRTDTIFCDGFQI